MCPSEAQLPTAVPSEEVEIATFFPGRGFALRAPVRLCAILCVLTLYGGELASQSRGTVSGSVMSADKVALAEARVRIAGTPLTTITRLDGAFEFRGVPVGRQSLEITRIGYSPKTMAILVTAGETSNASVVLEAFALETVTVTADADSTPGIRAFMERKARGSGWYFTREEIAVMQPREVTDVLRRVPGVQIEGGGTMSGGNPTARSGRNISGAGSTCSMTYYLNGSPLSLTNGLSINHFVAADDLAAVEVYTGSSQIPPEFNSSLYGSRCGVVAVWTRTSLDSKTQD
ncbi:MAG TPA: carboxypeptidase regulatory-like domain-containing protein [Gemmatimonadaceae bacterium]|nr:carboxypeptidase regulatory-like domain-containing protein [Gemmatimonadaceae bacterium]